MAFVECSECAAKPGSPVLCESCLDRRSAFDRLMQMYNYKAERGLVDVKYDLLDGGSTVEIASEIIRMEEAIEAGRARPLRFNDRKENHVQEPALYILMRTDMASMNPGKAMAQAAHAANAFIRDVGTADRYDDNIVYAASAWEDSTEQWFGTTLVLAAPNEKALFDAVAAAQAEGLPAETVLDPTYPIRDGEVTHLLPVITCAYVFTPCRKTTRPGLDGLELHP